jgi:hypothetical protein
MASVLATRASNPKMMELAIMRPASREARRETKASAVQ